MTDDRIPRIITFHLEDFWTRETAADYFAALRDQLKRQRRVHGRARIVVDLTAMPVQAQDIYQQMQTELAASHRPEDRVALVGGSALVRMQNRRLDIHIPGEGRMFDDASQALAWLEQT